MGVLLKFDQGGEQMKAEEVFDRLGTSYTTTYVLFT
jgi:hypothetical protein